MQHSFFHKLILTIAAGFGAACLFEFYQNTIVAADESINGPYRQKANLRGER